MPAPSSALTSSLLTTASSIQSFASSRTAVVDAYVSSLSTLVLNLVPPTITPEFPSGGPLPEIVIPTPPTFTPPVWVSPGFPAAFAGTLSIGDLEIAPFDVDPPTLVFGTAPTAFAGTLPAAPSVNLTYTDPTLTVTLPALPTLLELSVGTFGGLSMPTFDAADPVLVAVAPSIREYTPGANYTSTLLTQLHTTLLSRLGAGGTGLDSTVEEAIWQRGREREARSYSDAVLKIDQMEALGYALPPGMFADARLRLITETDYAERGHSREVMIKQAELALDSVKHALTTAVDLEKAMLSYTNEVEQRLFESTKYATEAGVAIYNAKVQAFAAITDVYKAKVSIYEARVRAEISRVEAYKAEVEAERAKASINQTLVEQYKAQIEAALSKVEIYKAEIAGIAAKAEIEKTKVLVYGEQVRGFVAQVNAYTAGVEGYRATLQAEQTKQEVYKSRVEAFTARVDASTRQVNARIEAYKGQITAKTAEYDGYRAAVQGEAARVQGLTQVNGVVADAYKSQVQAAGAYNDVRTKQWQAVLDQNQRVSEIAINAAKANSDLYVTVRSLALDAAKTAASVSAQIGAAAINAVNFSGSVSSSESYSGNESVSFSNVNSNSTSSSDSTNTNYNYSA